MKATAARTKRPEVSRSFDPGEDPNTRQVQSALTDFDRLVWEAERIWGVDRLPYLVSDELRQKWWGGIDRLNQAIRDNEPVMVRALVKNMIKGLAMLIAAAEQAGQLPLTPDIWETPLADGRVLRLVRGNPENSYRTDDRNVLVWSLEEVARLVGQNDVINRAKELFPGAVISAVRQSDVGVL